ncbi:AcrR family transcriptional regulator [Sphingobium fontiphilum]|uniref:AcrR family transcriptional regulator n=1 Tax=Sphingobium fontiphilum TaxID=944425 RepID=A0A7W6GP94_9SPHN|nr:TetR/AcrR family transcriptional regulator [Sphingobium fontiphilum]MBB3982322.1 AcrR family transcriptional regulator [Sphingobium fontiphilum]
MSDAASVSPAVDPRTAAAAIRRARMRERLLDAVLDLYQPGQGSGSLVIDDVIRAANVSRGSFYKYFDSLDAAVNELGERMLAELMAEFRGLFDDVPDPLVRAVGGASMAMVRAWHDPRWGGFTCRVDYVDYFARASMFDLVVRDALMAARDQGQMRFRSIDVAVDLIVGMTIEGRRRLVLRSVEPRAYIDEMIERTFIGLQADPSAIAQASDYFWRAIFKAAPMLPWWRSNGEGGPSSIGSPSGLRSD